MHLPATSKKHIKINMVFCIIKKGTSVSFSILSLFRQLLCIIYFIILLILLIFFVTFWNQKSESIQTALDNLDECENWGFNFYENEVYKSYLKDNRNCYDTYKYKALQGKLKKMIESSKHRHYERVTQKLSSISTSNRCYSSFPKNVKWQ